tara:strand:+ start:112 stop:417 length:306 start_codon:yes stop_codon:yes gene_type:complete
MDRNSVLNKAIEVINGARADDYGNAQENHERIANLWNVYLEDMYAIKPRDVAVMMMLLKVARISEAIRYDHKEVDTSDSFVDIAGYAALAEEMAQTEKENG